MEYVRNAFRLRPSMCGRLAALTLCLSPAPVFCQSSLLPVPVGVVNIISGPQASFGEECRQGIELGAFLSRERLKAQGFEMRLVYGDSQGHPRQGVSEFQKMLSNDGIWAGIVARSNVAMALNPLSQRLRVPLLAAAGHAEFVSANPYAFRFFISASMEGPAIAEKCIELGAKRAAIISVEEEHPLSLRASFSKRFVALGGTTVFDELIAPELGGESPLAALISRLKRKNPQVIFINGDAGQTGVLVRKIREFGLTQQLVSNFRIRAPGMLEAAGKEALEGLIFAEMRVDYPSFLESLRKLFPGAGATSINYGCFLSVSFLAQALSEMKGERSPQSLLQSMLAVQRLELADGALTMLGREAQVGISFFRFKDGAALEVGSRRTPIAALVTPLED